MKKLMALLAVAFLVNSVIAQTTAVNESFETWPAPEWNTYKLSLGGEWAHSTLWGSNMGYEGNGATHRINNDNCNNWLVSPQISVISDDYELSFYEYSGDLEYYVYSGVYISTGSGDPLDGDFVELTESLLIEDVWSQHTIDLSAYNGEDIYLAFVFNGTWHRYRVDEVVVSPNTLIDGALTQVVNPTGIDPVSGIKDVIVTLKNFGSDAIDNADFEWSINGDQQTTFQATGLGLNPGSEMDITLGQYDFTAQGDYLISVNLALSGDINPSNDSIESTYFVTEPKDAELTGISPDAYLPAAGSRDVSVVISNVGDIVINDFKVTWSVDDVNQADYTVNTLNLLPGAQAEITIGQYTFVDGLNEITATIVLSGDEDLSNNYKIAKFAVNALWESFEGSIFPPELWQADDYPFRDFFFPKDGKFYYASMTDDNIFGEVSDTLYTPLLQIEAGDVINFWVQNSAFFTNDDKLIWKDGTTGEIHLFGDIISELEQWDEVTFDISAAAGINYIGFVNNNPGSFGQSFLDLITSTAPIYLHDQDLGVKNLEFDYLAKEGENHVFNVLVKNYGSNAVSGGDYSVKIINAQGEELAQQSGVTLQSWNEVTIGVNYTFVGTEVQKIRAIIEYADDQAVANNSSVEYPVYAVPADVEVSDVGIPEFEDLNIPFNTGGDTWTLGTDDISQNLIYQDELPGVGYLYGITIYYHEIFAVGQYLPLQVSIKETGLDDLSGGWTDFDETQMVFNDTVQIYPGYHELYIPFDEPILISGSNNLVIQYYQFNPEWPYTMVKFFSTIVPEGPVRSIRLFDVYNLDVNNPPDYWGETSNFTYTSLAFQPSSETGVISGDVYDENNNPIEGALVQVNGTVLEGYTDATGTYNLPALPYADFEITASAFGYNDGSQTVSVNAPDISADFNLILLPLVTIQGSVYGSDAPAVPLEGVTVTITGYSDYSGNTNMNGLYFIENVYGEKEYIISYELYGYHTYTDTLVLADIDIDMENIVLNQEFISPYDVAADASLNQAVIEWFNPVTSKKEKMQNDSGIPTYSFTNEPFENVWLGNLFENEEMVTITSVEIYWDVYENAHDYITVDILDEGGNVLVTSNPTQTFNDSLMTIDVPNITVSGSFYAMVHWQDNEFSTDPLALDYEEGTPNTAYIKYPGEAPVLLSDFIGTPDASWMLRANVLKQDDLGNEGGPVSYNIYRGLVEDMAGVEFWDPINAAPITELMYTDNDMPVDAQLYTYAIEAVYVEGFSERTFSNFVELITGIDEIEQRDVEMYPNPASHVVNINGVMGATISIHNMVGAVVHSESILSETARINVADLPTGNYIIRITDPNSEKELIKKFIIAR